MGRAFGSLRILVLIVLACTRCLDIQAAKVSSIRAYHVFDKDHVDLHKYAAVLAAQEAQRKIRDNELKKHMNPVRFWLCKMDVKKNFNDPNSNLRRRSKKINEICEDYERRLVDTVESYGLDTPTFNYLSYEIMSQQDLKKQVMLQAFYYKLAADLEHNIVEEVGGSLVDSSTNRKTGASAPAPIPVVESIDPESQREHRTLRFSRALREVEKNRLEIRKDLQNKLGVMKFPKNMCDPEVLPAMAPAIQSACATFPKEAKKIINKHGLQQAEFDELLSKSRRNLIFRTKVLHNLRKIED